jgi:aldehyde:ferredoxin oxidoreductase
MPPNGIKKKMKFESGYFHKILVVDLTKGEARAVPISDEFIDRYVGGRGFGVKILWDALRNGNENMDPFDPASPLIIAPGPLTGTYMPAAGKTSFVALSPATNLYGDSNVGGGLGVEIRQAGYDAIVITGQAPELSYIHIENDEVRVVPSPHLAGKTVLKTESMLRTEMGDSSIRIAIIGPAGENLVKFACVTADWGRNAGRTGMGAVLGSKNVKAIAVRGSLDLPVHDIKALTRESRKAFRELRSHPYFEFWQQQGLMSVVDYLNCAGVLPTQNFQDGVYEDAELINGYEMEARYKIGDSACFGCPMCCGNINLVKEGKYAGAVVEGPEYETACMFGSNIGVNNFAFIVKANVECDELGIDTISTGNIIGVLMEAYTSGMLSKTDLDGIELDWGNEDGALEIMRKIAVREGVGDILADGARRIKEVWPELGPIMSEVKGLEQSAYDGRAAISMSLAYGTSDIGAHHARAWTVGKEIEMGSKWGLDEKADLVVQHQSIRPLFDMFGVCRLPWIELGFDEMHYETFFHCVTGSTAKFDDLIEKSRRIYDMTRLINVRRGVKPENDYPPPRVFDSAIKSGPRAGDIVSRDEYAQLLEIYYKKRGWDDQGRPAPEIAKEFETEPAALDA